jgi:hypothetical protein
VKHSKKQELLLQVPHIPPMPVWHHTWSRMTSRYRQTLPGWSSLLGAPLITPCLTTPQTHTHTHTHTHTLAENSLTCITHPTAHWPFKLWHSWKSASLGVVVSFATCLNLAYDFQTQLHSAITLFLPHTCLLPCKLAIVHCMIMYSLTCTNTNCKV